MPRHNGIRISLISQYDAKKIPEYRNVNRASPSPEVVDVSIPIYSSSQFWIRYSCRLPPQGSCIQYYYFKLYVAGQFQVAWGCGLQDKWKGETVFIPTETSAPESSDEDKKPPYPKLGLFFPRTGGTGGCDPTFEIRVYRAKARKRQQRQYAVDDPHQTGANGVRMDVIGVVKKEDPRRFYTYALMDPKDEPYTVFRYRCRNFANANDLRTPGAMGTKLDTPQRLSNRKSIQQQSPGHSGGSPSERLARSLRRRLSMSPKAVSAPSFLLDASSADQGTAGGEGDHDRVAQPKSPTDAVFESWKAAMWQSAVL